MQKESNSICKSSDVYVNPSTVPNIQNQLKETITKQCPWSTKEIILLKKLIHDIGPNCTLLSIYYEKRSVMAIYKKANKLYKKKRNNEKEK